MRDYPNMSYCMCINTLNAMRQVVNVMQAEGVEFIFDLSTDEQWAYDQLRELCKEFSSLADDLEIEAAERPLSPHSNKY